MRHRIKRLPVALCAALLLAGCASADKTQPAASNTAATTTTSTTSEMAGMNMGAGTVASEVPSVNGIKPVAIRTLTTSYWQDMEIQAQTMTPVPFVIFTSTGTKYKETMVKPAKDASFHLMVMLTDRHTHYQIPYASVWATILTSAGKQVYSDQQWPMISEYMGSHYGNNVTLPGPGKYTLKLLISPPVSARHVEYQHMWLQPHEVTSTFTWAPTK
jgi:uncharacterized protein involved in high-affinity Fe2+ transport